MLNLAVEMDTQIAEAENQCHLLQAIPRPRSRQNLPLQKKGHVTSPNESVCMSGNLHELSLFFHEYQVHKLFTDLNTMRKFDSELM